MLPDLGRRGEGWVALQFLLLVLVGFAALLGGRFDSGVRFAGYVFLLLGVLYVGATARHLGAALSPLPRPNRRGLRDRGLYAKARHPMYGGVLMLAVGWSLAFAPWALAPTTLLALVLDLKSRREEAWLVEEYPDYSEYRRRVRRRFWPGFY